MEQNILNFTIVHLKVTVMPRLCQLVIARTREGWLTIVLNQKMMNNHCFQPKNDNRSYQSLLKEHALLH